MRILESGVVVHHGSRIRREKSTKWFDLATLVVAEVLARAADHQPPGRSSEMIESYVADRFEEIADVDVRQLLSYLAYLGYLCREFEESWMWTETGSEWLRQVLATGSEVAGTKTDTFEELVSWVAVHACDRTKADEDPSGFCIDAIDEPLWAVRDFVMVRFCQIQVEIAQSQNLCGAGSLPAGTEMSDFKAAWRIGVLVRACERSAVPPR
ncbi:MAG: hypothetical protein J0H06_02335 [Actinobacteria bacterium]|nr:hypothetical protein [Actinomycetota bacterium]